MTASVSRMSGRGVRAAAFVLALAVFAGLARSQPILINFDDLPGMTNAPGLPIPVSSQLRDQYLASKGVRFSSGAPFVAVVVHGADTPSGVQIIGGSTPGGQLSYDPTNPIVVEFLDPTGTQPRVVSQVSIEGDLNSIPGTKTLEAYNLAGAMIGSITLPDSDHTTPQLISMPGIHSVHMYSSSATVGYDNLRFDTPLPPPTTCPDLNGDGVVNTLDLAKLLSFFGQSAPPGSAAAAADFNGDGSVNTFDLAKLLSVFGQSCV